MKKVPLGLTPAQAATYDAFCRRKIRHRLQSDAFEEAWGSLVQARESRRAQPRGDGRLTLLMGPTGVGKTTVWERIEAYAQQVHDLRNLRGCLPQLYVKADVPMSGTWQLKGFYEATLRAADEILIGHKQLPTPTKAPQVAWAATSTGLRQAALNMLRHRDPIAFCIDEAHHLCAHSSDKQREKNLDAIKTFADETVAPLLLIGSYESLLFTSSSARLGRRVHPVHLPRYNVDLVPDADEFLSVIHTFSTHLQFDRYAPAADFTYLAEWTVGCVGLLKEWFERALHHSLMDGASAITSAHIKACEPEPDLVAQAVRESNAGEAAMRGGAARTTSGPTAMARTSPMTPTAVAKPAKANTRAKPFKRNDIADPVGTARHPSPQPSTVSTTSVA